MGTWILHSPIAHGIVSGIWGAAVVDVHAFLNAKDRDELVTWSLKKAAFRWAQGAVSGGMAALSLQGLGA